MPVPAVQVQGLNAWRKDLKQASADLPKALGKAHQEIGRVIEPTARTLAGALGVHGKQNAAASIRAAAQQRGVVITATAKAGVPWALGVIMGQDRQTGWFGKPQYNGASHRQFPPHIGGGWEVGGPGGPRAVNEAIRDSLPAVEVLLQHAMDEITARAFPS